MIDLYKKLIRWKELGGAGREGGRGKVERKGGSESFNLYSCRNLRITFLFSLFHFLHLNNMIKLCKLIAKYKKKSFELFHLQRVFRRMTVIEKRNASSLLRCILRM